MILSFVTGALSGNYANEILGFFGGGNGKSQQVTVVEMPLHCGPNACTRLAGLSGGLAVALAAYGAHFVLTNPDISDERKRAMEHANRHHFLNTIGMVLGSMAGHYPWLTGSLFALGSLLFCVPSYALAIRNNRTLRPLTPYGGVLAMLGWFSFIL